MSDYSQTIVDREATAENAVERARRAMDWLISQGIIEGTPEPDAAVVDPGHRPGPRFEEWLDEPAGWHPTKLLRWNGVQAIAEKRVFHTTMFDSFEMTCPLGHRTEAPEAWWDAIDEWWDESGPALVRCAACGTGYPLPVIDLEPPFAFGFLGITFWNWPELPDALIDGVQAAIKTGRVVRVWNRT